MEENVREYSSLRTIGKKWKGPDRAQPSKNNCTFSYPQYSELAKKFIELFRNVLWKNPNEVFDQPNNILMN